MDNVYNMNVDLSCYQECNLHNEHEPRTCRLRPAVTKRRIICRLRPVDCTLTSVRELKTGSDGSFFYIFVFFIYHLCAANHLRFQFIVIIYHLSSSNKHNKDNKEVESTIPIHIPKHIMNSCAECLHDPADYSCKQFLEVALSIVANTYPGLLRFPSCDYENNLVIRATELQIMKENANLIPARIKARFTRMMSLMCICLYAQLLLRSIV
jgi:hypothetical protein